MADTEFSDEKDIPIPCGDNEDDVNNDNGSEGYVAPPKVTLTELQQLDADDESLVKYKKLLLAGASDAASPSDDPRLVVVEKLTLMVEGRDDLSLDLTGDISTLKNHAFTIKEGSHYKVRITFRVQHEIVAGLKYIQTTYRKGIKVDHTQYMVGSYGPKADSHIYITPMEDAPSGMLARGHYKIKSKFMDDDKHLFLEWEWSFDLKKSW